MRVFSVFGYSGSGKTTVVEHFIRELTLRNFTVGTVKEIHDPGFAMDTEGTNTYRHKKAGSGLVTARGKQETDILFPQRLPIPRILEFYNQDFVILEGVRDFDGPKILCARKEEEISELMLPAVVAISGLVANKLTEYRGLPVFSALTCIKEFVNFIERAVTPI